MKSVIDDYGKCYELASEIPQQGENEEIFIFSLLIDKGYNLNILDLGCAEGKLSVELAKCGHKIVAADISSGNLQKTRLLAKENNLEIETWLCDIENVSYEQNMHKFDVIYFMDVIEHLKNTTQALLNIRNLLKDDGVLIINTPNAVDPLRVLRYICRPKALTDFYNKQNLFDLHLQIYDYEQLEKTLNFVGFKIIQIMPNYSLAKYKFLNPFFRTMVWMFPFLSKNILVKIKKFKPLDVESQVEYWKNTL